MPKSGTKLIIAEQAPTFIIWDECCSLELQVCLSQMSEDPLPFVLRRSLADPLPPSQLRPPYTGGGLRGSSDRFGRTWPE